MSVPAYVEWLRRRGPPSGETGDSCLIQTHISYVVLSGERAYKIKKPVDFGFLDFRTLESRKRFCEEEVRLNARLSPDIYLGTESIRRLNAGAYALGESGGEVVDYAVVMRRIPAHAMFETILDRGGGSVAQARELAETLAAFHLRADRNAEIAQFGSVETVRGNWVENFEQTRPYVGRILPQADYDGIRGYVDRFLHDHAGLFQRRVDGGYVRDGHGDLRAAAVAFTDTGVRILDCIEFNDRMRYGDVAVDLAFLLMDLDLRGRAELADEVIARYLAITQDSDLPLLLPFYCCYRAYVRAKVDAFLLDAPEVAAEQKARAAESVRRHCRLALGYTGQPQGPRLIAMCGATGSGKSHLAAPLAARLGARWLASDPLRKRLAGRAPHERSGATGVGTGIYDDAGTARTYAALLDEARHSLQRGEAVVLDATFTQADQRAAVQTMGAEMKAPLDFLICEADDAVVRQRILARRADAGAASEGTWEVYQAQRQLLESLRDEPAGRRHWIDTGRPLAESVPAALRALGTTGAASGSSEQAPLVP